MRRTIKLGGALALVSAAFAGELSIFPERATIYGKGTCQHFVVTETEGNGVTEDVTSQTKLTVGLPGIAELAGNATVRGLATGKTRIEARYGGKFVSAELKVEDGLGKAEISFVKDIVPIFTRSGCAGSNCHGSIRGKGGFKLSLFGYEPDLDYQAILKAENGKRLNLQNPEQSLILQKPTFQIPHGGGERFKKDSLEYAAIRDWLAAGGKYDSAGAPRITSLSVFPAERRLTGLSSKQQLVVTARYTDGSMEDVTEKVQYTSNNDAVASVSAKGVVNAERPGETAVMVRTLGQAIVARIYVVKDPPFRDYPAVEANNSIDRLVFEKLCTLNVIPSSLSSDEDFLRRAYLDVLGAIPSVEEAKAFLDSKAPTKRGVLIDQLLDRPERAEFWATYFGDLFRMGFNESRDKGAKLFYNWIRSGFQQDRPYDQMVRELLVSQGNLFYNPTANFFFITRKLDPGDVATHVSQSLLGVRLECAKCHNHPWEKWTQDDFYGFAAFFARLGTKFVNAGSESNVYLRDEGEVIHPKTKKRVQPRYLAGDLESEARGEDIRAKLAQWMTSPSNPFFAPTMVNRIWRRYLGRGIVEPVDDFRITNPPSNGKLLDTLADEFVRHGYSIKHIERLILNSRTYQLSSIPNETNRHDAVNYSRYYLKRMIAEQLMDAIVQVTGMEEHFPGWARGTRAMAIPHGSPSYLLTIFGRVGDREFIRERDSDPNITQILHMINGETIQQKIEAPESRLSQWMRETGCADQELVERVFLATLSRRPRAEERNTVLTELAKNSRESRTRAAVLQDLEWALLNSKEFLYVH